MPSKPRVLVVLGTRPEAIKLASVIRALETRREVDCRVVLTGQHGLMLDQIAQPLGLAAAYDLKLMRRGQTLNDFASRALERLGEVLREEKPALVVVQGDTTSALCAALAAAHERVPVAHVEAGLRTFDRGNPFPEEANRVLIDDLSSLLFAPTRDAARNLTGMRQGRVFVTGNTIVDAVHWAKAHPRPVSEPRLAAVLSRAGKSQSLVLATMHRRESFDGRLARACAAMRAFLEADPSVTLLFPVHLNPNVQATVRRALRHPRAVLLPTLQYHDLVAALTRCVFVMTDSGGLQEEAVTLGKPVLVLRSATDRPEAVRAGVAALVGFEPSAIIARARELLTRGAVYRRMARPSHVYGDGGAGARIAAEIGRYLGVARAAKAASKREGPHSPLWRSSSEARAVRSSQPRRASVSR